MLDLIILLGNIYNIATVIVPMLIAYCILAHIGKQRGIQPSIRKLAEVVIFSIYIWMVFDVVGAGTIYEIGKYGELIRVEEITLELFESEGALTYILNIIMLMPLGFLLPAIWPGVKFRTTVLTGFAFSFLMEASQLLNRRNSALDDLIMNTIGAAIGFGIFVVFRKIFGRLFEKHLKPKETLFPYEYLFYIAVMFLGYFLLYNWRGYIYLFRDYFYN